MKVIYQKTIVERIQAAVAEADRINNAIERIDVTVREANQLSQYVQRTVWVDNRAEFRYYTADDAGKLVGKFYGVEIRVEPKL